jgi:hypothetical protein
MLALCPEPSSKNSVLSIESQRDSVLKAQGCVPSVGGTLPWENIPRDFNPKWGCGNVLIAEA